jgi:hypothetical protein
MEERIGSTVAEFMATEGNNIPIPAAERLHQVQTIWDELEDDGLICRTGATSRWLAGLRSDR